ncbi:MAG: 3-oxoadipate enol-lactonase [Actinomycetota bacterium]|nr:3-oxoadipate enol-lactonase [Actinomycetota bacterium]
MEGVIELSDGATLAFEDVGEGPVVTLLHPGLWDRRTWDPQVGPLLDVGFRVLRYDLRGYGGSSRLHGESFSNARDVVALLDARGVETTALVGGSMGGAVAIDTTLEFPGRVWALGAIASALGGVEETSEEETWWEERWPPIEKAMEAGDLVGARDLQLSLIWAPLGAEDETGARIRSIAMDNIHELTMDESAIEELDPPALARLGEIRVPALVVMAAHDPPTLRRCSELIAAGISGARLVTFDDADHVVSLRTPTKLNELLIGFLTARA